MAGSKTLFAPIVFGQPYHETKGVTTIAVKCEVGDGQYAFKGNVAPNVFELITAIKEGEKHWMIAKCKEGMINSIPLEIKKYNAEAKKYEELKDETAAKRLQWLKDGITVIIDPSGCQSLEIMAKTLAEYKYVVKPLSTPEGFHTIKFENDTIAKEINDAFTSVLLRWHNNLSENPSLKFGIPKTDEYFPHVELLNKHGLLWVPVMNEEELPKMAVLGGDDEIHCFPFERQLPFYTSIGLEMPTVKAKGNWNGGGSNVTVNTINVAEELNAREQFVIRNFALQHPEVKTLKDVADIVATPATKKEPQTYAEFFYHMILEVMGTPQK